MAVSRRAFLRRAAAVGAGMLGLHRLLVDFGWSQTQTSALAEGFGPLLPDPGGVLDLPQGFSYRIISVAGETMSDGLIVPGSHDGMAAFWGPNETTILVRNHELTQGTGGPFGPGNALLGQIDRSLIYDPGRGQAPARGGTTTLVYDTRRGRLQRHFLSLVGTMRNCAGGVTPWSSWITCEENVQRATGTFEKDHGYCFEIPASPFSGLVAPVPLKAMGRFNHEAVAVHPTTGIIYLSEDRDDGLFYRFLPSRPGDLAQGGRLQALVLRDMPRADTRNWNQQVVPLALSMSVAWVDMEDPESPRDDLRQQGFAKGAALFARGEGMWSAGDAIYFDCTSGGRERKGQVWRYFASPLEGRPEEARAPGTLELFIEPNDATLVDSPDNIAIAPWGDLIMCEDGPGEQFLVGVTPQGRIYKLARNRMNNSEFAGAVFSPDGSTFFVNIYTPGLTLAIHGPGLEPEEPEPGKPRILT